MNEKPRIFKHMGHFYIFLDTIIKLSTPDTCELMFTLKMCLWWLGAKVLRKTKNLSCPPFLQNEKKKIKPGIYANKAYKWIPGYGIFIKLILHGRMAFDAIVTL